MSPDIIFLMAFTAVLLVVSLSFCIFFNKDEILEEDGSEKFVGEIVSEDEFNRETELKPRPGLAVEDLNNGDVIHLVTQSGSKYRLQLIDKELARFKIRSTPGVYLSSGERKRDFRAVMRSRICNGRSLVLFVSEFSPDRTVRTSPVMRYLLVSKEALTA